MAKMFFIESAHIWHRAYLLCHGSACEILEHKNVPNWRNPDTKIHVSQEFKTRTFSQKYSLFLKRLPLMYLVKGITELRNIVILHMLMLRLTSIRV